jgi:hypothetical protein
MIAIACRWALKEWAVTIAALDRGDQILLLRKGGIHEKSFRIEHEEFLLYPTYEHQRPELLKPHARPQLAQTLAAWDPASGQVPLTLWCRVARTIEIMSPAQVEALSPLFIWTTDYAERRLHWRPKHPLDVLLVRAYRLPAPYLQRVEPYFSGCVSWIDLPQPVPVANAVPVLSDNDFDQKVREVEATLAAVV